MVVSFMTIGKKREKNYYNRILQSKEETKKKKGKNNKIIGYIKKLNFNNLTEMQLSFNEISDIKDLRKIRKRRCK